MASDMRIEYENRIIDIVASSVAALFSSLPLQILGMAAAASNIWSDWNRHHNAAFAIFFGFLIYAMVWAFLCLYVFFSTLLRSKRDATLLARHVLEAREDGLFEETKFNKSQYDWSGVTKVVSPLHFVAVYVDSQSAYVIPNRAFTSESQRKDFIAFVEGRMASSKARS